MQLKFGKLAVEVLGMASPAWKPIREMSSHTTHQGTLVHSQLSSLKWSWLKERNWCTRGDLHLEEKKKCRWRMTCQTFSQNLCVWGKSHHHHHGQSRFCTTCCALLLESPSLLLVYTPPASRKKRLSTREQPTQSTGLMHTSSSVVFLVDALSILQAL